MKVVSFGSLNYDLTIRLSRLPDPDETLRADSIAEFAGGKGANQAAAAARLGADTVMVGCVGGDDRGRWLLRSLSENAVDVSHVRTVEEPTGTALPLITPQDVSIIIIAGANAATSPADAEAAADVIAAADVLLLQGEVAAAGARRAAQLARADKTLVVFNPAPVDPFLVEALIPLTDVLVVNRTERAQVTNTGSARVVVTLGSRGSQVDGVAVPPFPATVLDPTGAGDAFCGALGVALAEGQDLLEATRFANAAGALATEVAGAQPSMPTREAVQHLIGDR